MERCNFAWAAGLFEGEGSICRLGAKRWQIALSSTDEDVVSRFWEIVKCGTKYGPYMNDKGASRSQLKKPPKPYWRWSCSNRDGILRLAKKLRPFLSARRLAKLDEAVESVRQISVTRDRPRRFD